MDASIAESIEVAIIEEMVYWWVVSRFYAKRRWFLWKNGIC